MAKKILITGASDGIGLETARILSSKGHHLLIHGRNPQKLDALTAKLSKTPGAGPIDSYLADLSDLSQVTSLASSVTTAHESIDVLINNAGVLKSANTITAEGMDIRFVVNTLAPYLLTQCLLPLMNTQSRVINLSSAAQAPVDLKALTGKVKLNDMEAYAQSKLAITMWSKTMAERPDAPVVIAVNPGSLLGTPMVKEGFGTEGKDILIGANILCRAALDDFSNASGKYFDNDSGRFADPHPDAMNAAKTQAVTQAIESALEAYNPGA